MIGDIKPFSPVRRLTAPTEDLDSRCDAELVAAVVGMRRGYIARALGRPGTRPSTFALREVLELLDLDEYQETFIPRSKVPDYLLSVCDRKQAHRTLVVTDSRPQIQVGDARELIPTLAAGSVQCVVTSSPYWGMRWYDNDRDVSWADGERCAYGFEQTPEGFIRHTIELLYLLKPALTIDGSVWWNLMDTYNTRTPIRGNARERLHAMGGVSEYQQGWTEHDACRHSAGHMYLEDGEQSTVPMRIAERASRIGYMLKSFITWRKNSSTPEPVKSRVTRQAEYVVHLSVQRAPYFSKDAWQSLSVRLGGPHPRFESAAKISDVWCLPTSTGVNGHGAEFPLALSGRCIALTSREDDLVLDPFIGSGTTALAAIAQGRRCVGFDISPKYVEIANERVRKATDADGSLFDAFSGATNGSVSVESNGTTDTQLLVEGLARNPV